MLGLGLPLGLASDPIVGLFRADFSFGGGGEGAAAAAAVTGPHSAFSRDFGGATTVFASWAVMTIVSFADD